MNIYYNVNYIYFYIYKCKLNSIFIFLPDSLLIGSYILNK